MNSDKVKKGLVIVYTGEGKGKTSAALGGVLRAFGHGFKIKVFHFIKKDSGSGEQKVLRQLEIEVETLGKGFTWNSENIEDDIRLARNGWTKAANDILSGDYDLIVLDELNYVLDYAFLDSEMIIETLRKKPQNLHVIITGRGAPDNLVEFADLVTEMKMVKHPYHSMGLKAQKGVEY